MTIKQELARQFIGQDNKEPLRWIFYDRRTVGTTLATLTAPARTQFFLTAEGSATNRELDTNWVSNEPRLSGQQAFVIKWIQVELPAGIVSATATGILLNSVLELTIDDRRYLITPLTELPSGGGVSGYDSTASTPNLTNGTPDVMNRFVIGTFENPDSGLVLKPQNNFKLQISTDYATATARITVKLVGEYYRNA